MMLMKIVSVNTGRTRPVAIHGRQVFSAIGKSPRSEPVAVLPLGLEGDEQADLSVHGGLSKAVYAYPSEHYRFWQTVRAQAGVGLWDDGLPWGAMGENLTLQGLVETDLWVGDKLHLPGCVLVVSEPRFPCFKFAAAMGFAQSVSLMTQSAYCGAYLSVLHAGTVTAEEDLVIEAGPRLISLIEVFRSRCKSA